MENEFFPGKIHTALFIKKSNYDLLIVHIYIDNIIFGTTNYCLCEEFSKLIEGNLKMRIISELNFYLDYKSSNVRMWSSSTKTSIQGTFLRSLGWMELKQARL